MSGGVDAGEAGGVTRTATDGDFAEKVLNRDRPVLVDFWAEWCGPCKGIAPILDAMAADHADKIDIVKIKVDENPLTAEKYNISSIPALLVFDKGEVVTTLVGAKPRGMIESALGSYLD